MIDAGTVFQGRYKIVRLIGHGGMGAVYEALDSRLGDNPVALKQSLFASDQLRRAFEREAILLARLRHPNLPKVFDHFDEGTSQFLVMEYILGSDLEQLLVERGRPFPLDIVLTWSEQILDALKYLHTRVPPVIHRDIKPGNLKLTPEGQLMLIDFGLAKGQGGTSSIVGYSAHYAPLEQLQREGTGPESDLYSLAATIYRLLTGIPPTTSLIRLTEKAKQRPDPLQPVSALLPIIPASISQVISHAMELDKEDRLKSAVEMLDALRAASSAPVPLPPVTPPAAPTPERMTQVLDVYQDERPSSVPGEEDERHRVTYRLDKWPPDVQPQEAGEYSTNLFQRGVQEVETEPKPVVSPPLSTPSPKLSPRPSPGPSPGPSTDPPLYSAPQVRPDPAPNSQSSARAEWGEKVLTPEPPRMAEEFSEADKPAVAQKSPKSYLIWLPAVLLVPILLILYWLFTREATPATTPESGKTTTATTSTAAPHEEVMSYAFEVDGNPRRLVTEADLPARKGFRLHFRAPSSGYLYVIAPDEEKRQVVFLNDTSSNMLQPGADYIFPSGGSLIEIDAKSAEVKFTIIFSQSRLTQLGFFNQSAHALSPAELNEFETFRRAQPAVEAQANREQGLVRLTQPAGSNGASIFEIIVRNRK
jgi:serine/threonine protein kinase